MRFLSSLQSIVALNALIGLVSAYVSPPYVPMGSCEPFAVVAGATVTNGGASEVNGDLAISPGSALAGFPPGKVFGTEHLTDPTAASCMFDLEIAITNANSRPADESFSGELGGRTLLPGVYKSDAGYSITNILYLDGAHDPVAAWIFIMATSLSVNSGAKVVMVNYDNTKGTNVWWSCSERADIYTTAAMQGIVMAYQSIAAQTGATTGPLMANIGQVSLDSNVVNSFGVFTNDTKPIDISDDDDNEGELSAGAIAGIVIGGLVFLIIVAVLLWFFCAGTAYTATNTGNGNSQV